MNLFRKPGTGADHAEPHAHDDPRYPVRKTESEWRAQLDPLQFESEKKFDAGCGWPSWYEEIEPGRIERITDTTHGMRRVEVRCANCGTHLGHVFPDGPEPTGERYCINSAAIDFVPKA
ncbi:MAG: peptide-methionine (R)-S-oxide reductase [Burkholderiales bacterium PBB5]|nr:MAG: peptide-methionine (R)-S-oxide reductase [Burkholderiales bacterium PBB5]